MGAETSCSFCLDINNRVREKTNCQPDIVMENVAVPLEVEKKMIKGYIRLDDIQDADIKVAKNGKRYLNFVLIPSNSQYGDDFMTVTDTPKGEKGNILGNCRFIEKKQDNDKAQDNDVPFQL